jgi:(2S)-methylsuccinyl-CoA dehydrogenase
MQDTNGAGPAIPTESLMDLTGDALAAAETLESHARRAVADSITADGRIDPAALEREQFAAHGFAWLATYVEALRQLRGWAERCTAAGTFGEAETLVLQAAYGEYLGQMAGGIAMSQGEIVRPGDMGLDTDALDAFHTPAVAALIRQGNTAAARQRLAECIAADVALETALGDETLALMQEQFRRFADEKIAPHCHDWHVKDTLIPLPLVEELSALGVFGLTVPEDFGGLGLGKMAMCVVTEELSRGYIGVGSLGTRSEIAAELIRLGGTDAQKRKWLPKIASGEILPTAVVTEPNTGSDLGSLRTRAERDGDVYRVHGNKTWITHAARSDLMTLLVRTDPDEPGYRGLSMFLAEKPRGSDAEPFPAPGMTGGEIRVLGYRGMKEYELAFDGFAVAAENLLGEAEGDGFKQLMATFESARSRASPARSPGWRWRPWPRASSPISPPARRIPTAAAISRPAWPSCSPPAPLGPTPTTRCRSTAATAMPRSTRFPACCATRASSTSSRAPRKFSPTSSPAACSAAGTEGRKRNRRRPANRLTVTPTHPSPIKGEGF